MFSRSIAALFGYIFILCLALAHTDTEAFIKELMKKYYEKNERLSLQLKLPTQLAEGNILMFQMIKVLS